MSEAVILSLGIIGYAFSFILGTLVGGAAILNKHLESDDSCVTITPSGNKISMWRSYANNKDTYVACNVDNEERWMDGDCVVFDENGRIKYVEQHEG